MDLNRPPHHDMANRAAEEIRALNHLTLDPRAFHDPVEVATLISLLATLVQRLPQALEQSETGLKVLHERGAVRMVDRSLGDALVSETSAEVMGVASSLSEARRLLRQAHRALADASGPLARMSGVWEGETAPEWS